MTIALMDFHELLCQNAPGNDGRESGSGDGGEADGGEAEGGQPDGAAIPTVVETSAEAEGADVALHTAVVASVAAEAAEEVTGEVSDAMVS